MADTSAKGTIIAQFVAENGDKTGTQLNLPVETTTSQLEILINHLLSNVRSPSYDRSFILFKFLFPFRKKRLLILFLSTKLKFLVMLKKPWKN